MAEGGVRDLLVQLRLDNKNFRTEIAAAKEDVRLLKAQFKEAESDTSLEDVSGTLKQNLEEQLKALESQAKSYTDQIEKLQKAIGDVGGPESEYGTGLVRNVKSLQTQLANTNTAINNTKAAIVALDAADTVAATDNIAEEVKDIQEAADDAAEGVGGIGEEAKNVLPDVEAIGGSIKGSKKSIDELIAGIEQIGAVAQSSKNAYDSLLGWSGEVADDADAAAVSWETAMAMVYKIAEGRPGVDDSWLERLRQWNISMSAQVPVTFEELAAIEANAMQAGGVAADAVMEFTDMFSRLMASSDLTMDEGAMLLGKFLTVTGASSDQYGRLGSVIVALGNNFAATESQIVETAQRSASALKIAGMSAEDILAISASALALGMEPDAAASSMEKLVGKLAKGAAIATTNYESLLASIRAVEEPNGNDTDSAYDFLVRVGEAPKLMEDLIGETQMSRSDLMAWLNSAALAEKYASALGMSVQQFGQYWNGDPGMAFANFFQTIGQMGEGASGELLTVLDWLGVYGIRERRQAANFAMSTEVLINSIAMARNAYQANEALMRESETLFQTTESQRTMNQNKNEAFLAEIGKTVAAIRQPFDDFWADLKLNFVTNMPEWITTGAGLAVEGLSALGSLISGVGDFAQGIYYTGHVIKDIKDINWKQMGTSLSPLLKGAGITAGVTAGVAGLFYLGDLIYTMATSTEEIANNLNNIKIVVDEESKNQALAAIKEVQAASDRLANKETSEEWAKISRVVKAGYGDMEMFGTAIAYEQALVEKQLHDLTVSYGLQIDELNSRIIAASDAGDDVLAAALMADREAVNAEWKAKAAAIQDAYSLAISQVFNGMLGQREGMAEKLEQLNKDYNLLGMLLGLDRGFVVNPDTTVLEYKAALKAAFEGGLVSEEDFNRYYNVNSVRWDAGQYAMLGWDNMIKDLLGRMSPTISALFSDPNLYGLFTSAMEGGIFENADVSQLEGALAGVLAAINMKNVADQGGSDISSWGDGILQLLVDALKENKNLTGPAVQEVRDAVIEQMREVFSENGQASGATAVGAMVTGNLATGILSGKSDAVGAMKEVIAAVVAEAELAAPGIAAALNMGGGGGGFSGGTSYGGTSTTNTWNQNFTVTGSLPSDRRSVRQLAQEVMKEMKRMGKSIGQ